jgi:hypothetical protein
MAFNLKNKLGFAKDTAMLPVDLTWFVVGAAAIILPTLVIAGYVFLKDRKNPFYRIENPFPPDEKGHDDETSELGLENPVVDTKAHSGICSASGADRSIG